MADVFAQLAASAAPDRSLESALKERQAKRDEALRAVGEALLVFLAEGGSLDADELGAGDSKPRKTLKRALPPEDEDTGETVFAPHEPSNGPPTVSRRRRRTVSGGGYDTTGYSSARTGARTMPPDPDSLKTLAESFGNAGPTSQVDALASLRSFMDAVGDAEPPSTPLEFLDGIQRLARVSDRTDRWKPLPRRVQQLFLAYCTCKARVWQENLDLGSSRHEVVLEQVFRALTRYSARERPGFVHGLSRTHRAERESWAEDAHYWWTELCLAANIDPEPSNIEIQLDELHRTLEGKASDGVIQAAVVHAVENGVNTSDPRLLKMLAEHPDALEDEPRLRAVRRALRDFQADNEPSDSNTEETPLIEDDWPFLHVTKDKAAVIAGGDARPEATERVRLAFQFDTVTWHADPQERRLESLAQRIRGGNVDLVFFLARFSSHAAQSVLRDACKEAGVPFVRIEHGYGVQQLKLAIENWMHGK